MPVHFILILYFRRHLSIQGTSFRSSAKFARISKFSLLSNCPTHISFGDMAILIAISNVHYRTHNRPPTVSILGQPNPVHISTSHLLDIHPNIIHPSTSRSPQWALSLQFPQQEPISPLLTHTRHMPSPSHSSPFYPPNNIG